MQQPTTRLKDTAKVARDAVALLTDRDSLHRQALEDGGNGTVDDNYALGRIADAVRALEDVDAKLTGRETAARWTVERAVEALDGVEFDAIEETAAAALVPKALRLTLTASTDGYVIPRAAVDGKPGYSVFLTARSDFPFMPSGMALHADDDPALVALVSTLEAAAP